MNLLQEFKTYLFSQEVKPSKVTVKNYLSDINHFIRWFEESFNKSFSPSEVTKHVIDNYKLEASKDFSASSIERHLSSLRKFFSFLKANNLTTIDPFKSLIQVEANDPWHIKDFKSNLYVFNASHLTIKNYLIDIKQFLNWAEEVTGANKTADSTSSNILNYINSDLVEEYKQRLISQGVFSPSTINRKLSSLRKYVLWLQTEGLLGKGNVVSGNIEDKIQAQINLPEPQVETIPALVMPAAYSSFPPYRLFQKLTKGINLALDAALITHLVTLIEAAEHLAWKTKGQPIFSQAKKIRIPAFISHDDLLGIKNIKKEIYAPLEISTKNFPWHKKAWFTLKYQRPNWYRTYHSYSIVHYFHFAVLIIFVAGLAFGFYNGFVSQGSKNPTLAANVPTNPPRILSFQGRLTDNNDNPVTSGTNLRFAIYNSPTASGGALLWQEVDLVSPDTDGIFNAILGNVTSIPQSLFSENNALWLGVTVGVTPELTPRQQLATVAFAANSETLQGLLPITATSAGTTNVVLALNSSGNLVIGGSATPTFQATGGQFTLSGQTVLITTNAGSNSNVILQPDGLGKIELNKPIVNNTLNNNIASALGSVEIDDLFSILATSSGQSAFTLNQNGAGPLISASASGVQRFTVDNAGNVFAAGDLQINGGDITSGNTAITIDSGSANSVSLGASDAFNISGNFSQTGSTTFSTGNGLVSINGNINTDLIPNSTASDLGSLTNYWGALYANNIFPSTSSLVQGFLQRNNGALSPTYITDDFLFGGTSTSSALFRITGGNKFTGTSPVASIAANTSFAAFVVDNKGSGDLIVASSSAFGTNPQRTQFQVTGTGALYTRAFYDLDNSAYYLDPAAAGLSIRTAGSASISSNLTFAAGAASVQSTAFNTLTLGGNTTGQVVLSGFNGAVNGITFSGYNTCTLKTNASGVITCGTDNTGSAVNWWNQLGGVLSPVDIGYDFALGGNSTSSAKFSFTGVKTGQTIASISGQLVVMPNNGYGGNATISGALTLGAFNNGTIQTTNNRALTLGGNSTGNIVFAPNNTTVFTATSSGLMFAKEQNYNLGVQQTTTAGGIGGALTVHSGDGGLGGGTGGSGGALNLKAGKGVPGTTFVDAGSGGSINILAGTGGDNSQGAFGGAGGNINIAAGNSGNGEAGDNQGGNIVLTPRIGDWGNGGGVNGVIYFNSATYGSTYTGTGAVTLSSGGAGGLTLDSASNTLTIASNDTTLTASGITTVTLGTSATINAGATALNLQAHGTVDVNIAGGSGATGCTITNSNGNLNCSGTISSGGVPITGINWWNQLAGALSPLNITNDFLLGGTTTSSAEFSFTGVKTGNTIASVSGQLIVMPNNGYGGKVGIGTTNPGSTLETAGTITINPLSGDALLNLVAGTGRIQLNGANIISANSGVTTFAVVGSEKARLDSNGNFGIGTTSPTARLDVVGDASVSGDLSFRGASTAHQVNILDNGTLNFTTSPGGEAVANSRFFIQNNGYVGIGTTNPGALLDINPSSGAADGLGLRLRNGGGGSTWELKAGSPGINNSYFTIKDITNNATRLTINNLGYVGVNTTSPGGLFSVGASSSFQVDNNGAVTSTSSAGQAFFTGRQQGAGYSFGTGIFQAISDNPTGSQNNFFTGKVGGIGGTTTFNIRADGAITTGIWNGTAISNIYGGTGQNSSAWTGIPYVTSGTWASTASLGNSSQCLLGGATPTFGSCATGTNNWWNQLGGVLSPVDTGYDLAIGGNSTSSAEFSFTGVKTGNTIASVSGQLIVMANNGYGGKLGIGTTTPLYPLDVNGTAKFSRAGVTGQNIILNGGDVSGIYITANSQQSAEKPLFISNYSGEVTPGTANAIQFNVGTSGSPVLGAYISNTGTFGIGTTSPTAKLDVTGATSIGGQLTFRTGSGATIQSTSRELLTIGGNTTGGIVLSPDTTPQYGVRYQRSFTWDPAGDSLTRAQLYLTTNSTNNAGNQTGILQSIRNIAYYQPQPGATYSNVQGNYTEIGISGGTGTITSETAYVSAVIAASGTVGTATGFHAGTPYTNSGTGAIGNTYGVRIANQGNTGVTNSVGLYIDAQSGASNTSYGAIIAGGNVGIGTTAPLAALDVNGTVVIGNTTDGISLRQVTGEGEIIGLDTDNNQFNHLDIRATTGTQLYLNTNGNVGIGTTNPVAPLHIESGYANNAALIVNNLNSGDIFSASASGDTKFKISNIGDITVKAGIAIKPTADSTSAINFGTSGGSWFATLDTINRRLGIGTIAPLVNLDVRGNSGTLGVASISGRTSFASLIINNDGIGDLFSASSSGTQKFTISRAGGIALNGNYGTSGQCIIGGTVASWGTCGSGGGGNSPFQELAGAIVPNNSTEDLLIGGQATSSAIFALINVNSGIPTLKIWDSASHNNSLSLSATATETSITASTGIINIGQGGGTLYVQTDIQNDSTNNLGAIKITGRLNVLPTATNNVNSNAALIVNNPGSGDIFSASGGGTTRFTIANNGNITSTGTTLTASSLATIDAAAALTLDSTTLTLGGGSAATIATTTNGLSLDSGSNVLTLVSDNTITATALATITSSTALNLNPNTGTTYTLGTSATTLNLFNTTTNTIDFGGAVGAGGIDFAGGSSSTGCTLDGSTGAFGCSGTISSGGVALSNWWKQIGGLISPVDNGYDFALGGSATSSALFSFTGIKTGATIASTSGQLIVMPNNGWGGNVGIGTTTPNAKLSVQGVSDLGSVGSDLVTNGTFTGSATGWTLGTNWTYNSNNIIHAAGAAGTVTQSMAISSGKVYRVTFTIGSYTAGSGGTWVSLGGGSSSPDIEGSGTYTLVLTAGGSNTNLLFQTDSTFAATFDNITVVEVTTVNPLATVLASNGNTTFEVRSGGSGNNNTFLGLNAGLSLLSGATYNTAVGSTALIDLTTGDGNTAMGYLAGQNLTTGSNNIFLGYESARGAISVSDSVILGYDAGYQLISGNGNVLIGSLAGQSLVNGTENVCLGYASCSNITGSEDGVVGLGGFATASLGKSNATALGWNSIAGGTNSTAIGANSEVEIDNAIVLGGTGANKVKVGIGTTIPLTTFDVRGDSGTLAVGSFSGTTSFASLIANNDGVGDLFSASKSGKPIFTVRNNGQLTLGAPYYTAGCTALETNSAGTVICGVDNDTGVNWWNQLAGALSPVNTMNDFLLGSSATSTAKFAFTGLKTGQTIASISGQVIISPNNGYGGNIVPAIDNVQSLGSSASGRWKDIFLGPSTLHLNCKTTDGCNIGYSYDLGIKTTTGDFEIGLNGNGGNPNTLFRIKTQGAVEVKSFNDLDNSAYFLDPAATGNSLIVAGSVGVGTASPQAKFHIDADGTGGTALAGIEVTALTEHALISTNSAAARLILNNQDAGFTAVSLMGNYYVQNGAGVNTTKNPGFLVGQYVPFTGAFHGFTHSGGYNSAVGMFWNNWASESGQLSATGSDGTFIKFSDGEIDFSTDGAEGGRFDSGGNLVVGSINDAQAGKLQIRGGTEATLSSGGSLLIGLVGSTNMIVDEDEISARSNGAESTLQLNPDGGALMVHQGQAGGTEFTIQDNGNVGIGDTTPDAKLDVENGSLRISNTTDSINWELAYDSTNNYLYIDQFGVNRYFEIKAGGGVVIPDNAAANTNILQVGDDSFFADVDAINTLGLLGFSDSTIGNLKLGSGGGTIYGKSSNIGIGNSNPRAALDVTGSASLSGDLSFTNGDAVIRVLNGNDILFQSSVGGPSVVATTMTITNGQGTANGKVGIGTTAPDTKLQIEAGNTIGIKLKGSSSGAASSTWMGFYDSGNTRIGYVGDGSTGNSAIQLIADTGTGITITVGAASGTVGLCHGTNGGGNHTLVDCNGAPGDIAEFYPGTEELEPGDLVTLIPNDDPKFKYRVVKSQNPYDINAIGVVSTVPTGPNGSPMGEGTIPDSEYPQAIGLSGRLPIKVSLENGPIKINDYLTSSSIPGVAMKATKTSRVIGRALEDYDGSVQVSPGTRDQELIRISENITPNKNPQDPPVGVGKILMFTNPTWYDPDVQLASTGDLNFVDHEATQSAFTIPHYFTLEDVLGNPVEKIGAFSELAVANLRAGLVSSQQIITGSLSVTSENLSIRGQSIRDYIAGIVNDIINNTNGNIISPIASVDQVHTNLIIPVSPASKIALKLENDNISILNGNSSSSAKVVSFDNKGNATLSGSLAVNLDATIGGTLRASRIIADQIEGLNIQAATVSANYITNNYYNNSSSSAFPTLLATPSNVSSASSNIFSGLFSSNSFINIATYSSELAYIENLNAANAAFSQSFTVFGSTTLSDTSVVGQLAVNGSMILSDNSINVLGSDLHLQSLRQGGLSIMAGLFYIDTNGNVTTEGDATIKGTLYANAISPIPGQDLAINLGSASALTNPSLRINNASGSSILAINQKGDLQASGSATFGKLNIGGLIAPALAVSPTEVIATGSAGTGTINTSRTQMTINNALVTDKSLIYITPTSNTNQTIFLLRQEPGESFTVGVQNPTLTPIKFNWIIVN